MASSRKNRIALIIFVTILVVFHVMMLPGTRDDLRFAEMLDIYTPGEFLATRYFTWTSRLIIEFFLIFFARHLILWKIVNFLMCLLFAYEVLNLSGLHNYVPGVIGLVFFPVWYMSESGWCTTFMNYIWPLSVGFYSLSVLKALYVKEKTSTLKVIFSCIVLVFALNIEQIAVVFFCIFVWILLLGVKDGNKPAVILSGVFLIETIAMMVFSLTCPGNTERVLAEAAAHMPEFASFNVLDKLILGVNSTFSEMAARDFCPFFFFACLIVTAYVSKKRVGFVGGILSGIYYACVYLLGIVKESFLKPTWPYNVWTYVFFVLNICFALTVFLTLISLFKDIWKGLFVGVVFGSGFLSRIMLGFSPTCFESGHRTFTFYDVSLLMCALILISVIPKGAFGSFIKSFRVGRSNS